MILRFLIRENQIREKSGNLIAKNVWPPCIKTSLGSSNENSLMDISKTISYQEFCVVVIYSIKESEKHLLMYESQWVGGRKCQQLLAF